MMIAPIALALAKEFLPALISKITGPKGGEVAKAVVDTAVTLTGAPTPEAALEALRVDTKLAHEYRLALLNHAMVIAQLDDADRASSRARDIEVRKLSGGDNKRANWMVAMAAGGLVGSLAGMVALAWIKAKHPEAISEGVFAALLTQLANIGAFFGLSLRDAFTFEFGSSRGSREKDALLAPRE